MSDPIADLLTRIRNAGKALLPAVELPHSRMKESVAKILKGEGYVGDVAVEGTAKKKLTIRLKYQGKKCVIEGIKRVSKPGLRRYVGSTEIPRVSGAQAKKKNLGGELLCYVW
jgi:small subunit ribosomal protein S8